MHSNDLIRAVRRQHEMTQAEFAEFLGIPVHIVMQWEGDMFSPPLYVATLIGRIFDLADGCASSCGRKEQ